MGVLNKLVHNDGLSHSGDGLSCLHERLEEDLGDGPKLKSFVDVAVLDGLDLAFFKTVKALRRVLFFFAS